MIYIICMYIYMSLTAKYILYKSLETNVHLQIFYKITA